MEPTPSTTTIPSSSGDPLPGPEAPGGPGAPPQPPAGIPPPKAPPPPSRTAVWWVAGAVAVVAVAGVIAAAWPRHHHKPTTRLVLPASGPIVSAGGRELVSLLQAGEGVTFHATYRVIGAANETLSFEIWQSASQVREDTSVAAGGHTAKTESFTQDKVTHLCVQRDGGAWNCARSSVDPNNILSTVTGAVAGQAVAITDTTIGGRKVRCFQVGSTSQGVELCATSNGVPVLIASAQARYELVTLSSSVDSAVFNPPAPDGK